MLMILPPDSGSLALVEADFLGRTGRMGLPRGALTQKVKNQY